MFISPASKMWSFLVVVFLQFFLGHTGYTGSTDGPFKKTSYDFIIAGGGSAGAVLANRLTENHHWNVLLLEAGNEPAPESSIPLKAAMLQSTGMNWGYKFQKQDNMGYGFVNERTDCAKGKGLGGGSSTNYMLNIRGNRRDFDLWTEHGNMGWSYDEVLHYFIKMENSSVAGQDTGYHGSAGPMNVEEAAYRTIAAEKFVEAFVELGYAYTDYNGKNQTGVSFVHGNTNNGVRESTCTAYLDPIRDRSNLEIVTGAHVSKITFSRRDTADGVKVIVDDAEYSLKATKEVIVSCGALNTPQLMMLSGIGPREHLEHLNIPVIKDLPVGQNLHDHLTFLGLIVVVDQPIVMNTTAALSAASAAEYAANKTGPFTTFGMAEALGFVKTTDDPDTAYPDVQLTLLTTTLPKGSFGMKPELWDEFMEPLTGKYAFTVLPTLYHAKSHGYVELNSTDPKDPPIIYGGHLTDSGKEDFRSMIKSIRIMQDVVNQPALQAYGAKIWDKPIPGCVQTFDTDEYWECALTYLGTTIHHPSSTCKMGPSTDSEAVVNWDLRVHGIKRLRVVDGSIVPTPQSSHSPSPTIMIAEKASDLIKASYR